MKLSRRELFVGLLGAPLAAKAAKHKPIYDLDAINWVTFDFLRQPRPWPALVDNFYAESPLLVRLKAKGRR